MAAKKKAKKGTLFGKPRSKVVKHPGAFSAAAAKAGMSTSAYANKVLKDPKASTKMKRRASLAKAFETMRKKKAAKKK